MIDLLLATFLETFLSPLGLVFLLPLVKLVPMRRLRRALQASSAAGARLDRPARPSRVAAREEPPITAAAGCRIESVPVLNGEERRIAARIDALLREADGRFRLLAQVSMDEFLSVRGGRDDKARFALRGRFSQKRVDFLIVDDAFAPVLAIEYQGSGHRAGNWERRDATKHEILRITGLPLCLVEHRQAWDDIEADLRGLLGIEPLRAMQQA
jgi:hypothetical protein